MDRLISLQASIDAVKSRKTAEQCEKGVVRNWTVDLCVDALEKLPSAQPEQKKGEWINRSLNILYPEWERYTCSVCGKHSYNYNFCPNCGAKMEDGNE